MQCLKVAGDDLARVLKQLWWNVFEHPLDDAATILVEAEVDEVLLKDVNDVLDLFKAKLSGLLVVNRDGTHFFDDLLDDMVSIVVVTALHEFTSLQECPDQAHLLVNTQDLQRGLDHSAAVLMARVPIDVRLQVMID